MKTATKYTLSLLFVASSFFGTAQLPSSGQTTVLDGVYQQTHVPTKRVVSYTHLREADVIWGKRIWRIIDTRERNNFSLYYPEDPISDRMSLFNVVKYAVFEEGSLTVYEDDMFYKPVLPPNGNRQDPAYIQLLEGKFGFEQVIDSIDNSTGLQAIDFDGNAIQVKKVVNYTSTDIIEWRIKEDWFFDKQKSVMDVRIIAIAPVVNLVKDGQNFGPYPLFWLYFPEARYVFQNFFVYNPQNDAMRMSFDDLFWKRKFTSYVYKESNVYDRVVSQEALEGIEQQLISERIKEEIFKIEHDLWHY